MKIAERFAEWLTASTGKRHSVIPRPDPPDFLLTTESWLELSQIYFSNEQAKFENQTKEGTFSLPLSSPDQTSLRLFEKLNEKLSKTSYRTMYESRGKGVLLLTCQDFFFDEVKAIHDSAEFSAIYLRGVQSFSGLDAVSKLRFSAFNNRFFKNFEAMYFSHRDGTLSPSLWGEIERTMSDMIAYPGIRQWWETRKHWHSEEFGRVVEEIIAKGNEPTAYATYDLDAILKT